MKRKAAFMVLGCKVNQTENEGMAQLFRNAAYDVVPLSQKPDVIVINTCAVTGVAAGKSRRLIRRLSRDYPQSVLAVMGCYGQLQPAEAAGLGAHVVVGTQQRVSLLPLVEEYLAQRQDPAPLCAVRPWSGNVAYEELPLVHAESRARATIKVQDGCGQACAYCTVPQARGPSRSRDLANVLEEACSLLATGHREIVLTGIHLGLYGRDQGRSLAELVDAVAALPELGRLRLGSVESEEFDTDLLRVLEHRRDKICDHFHIPLQSGADSVLRRMNRPYTQTGYKHVLERIRASFPDAALTTDIMAGFPGESEEEHQESLSFVRDCAFADLHAFPFSARPGTVAASMSDQVQPAIRERRVRELIEVGRCSRRAYVQSFYGCPLEVLLETCQGGEARGHSRNYIEVLLPGTPESGRRSGDLVTVVLTPDMVHLS